MQAILHYLQEISPLRLNTIELIRPLFQRIELAAGDYFIEEGQYAKTIGFLESGVLRAFFLNREGKEYNKQFFVSLTLVGAYASLISGQPNRIAQQALTDCVIWQAPYDSIQKLYEKHHDLERLGRKLAEYYFLEKEQKELEMALLDAEKRYLLFRKTFPTLEQQIPQYHIASYLGISATQLSRVRKKIATL